MKNSMDGFAQDTSGGVKIALSRASGFPANPNNKKRPVRSTSAVFMNRKTFEGRIAVEAAFSRMNAKDPR